MKKYLKKSLIILVTLILVTSMLSFYTSSEATSNGILIATKAKDGDKDSGSSGYSDKMKDLIGEADKSEGDWASEAGENAENSINNIMGVLIIVVRILGVTVAVAMLLVFAMNYMSAAPGDKAEIKKSAAVYVVGAVILFATTGILGIINQFASGISI